MGSDVRHDERSAARERMTPKKRPLDSSGCHGQALACPCFSGLQPVPRASEYACPWHPFSEFRSLTRYETPAKLKNPSLRARAIPAALLLISSSILILTSRALQAADPPAFTDPAPPTVVVRPPRAAAEPQANPDATFHAAPKPLARDAVTSDWTSFLGPSHNGVSPETKLLPRFPKNGPQLVWEVKKGSGYSAPAVLGDRLVLLHRVEGDEVVDCLKPDTGQRYWRLTYPSNYMDRYGYCDGPRASPVIAAGKNDGDSLVYTDRGRGNLALYRTFHRPGRVGT